MSEEKLPVLRDYSIQIGGDTRYRYDYCQMLVNHRASTGKSFASFGVIAGVGVATLKKWVENHPEFKEACELAEVASLSYWEDMAHDQANGDIKGSSTTLLAMLKNNFSDHYKDKTEVEHTGGVVFKIDTGIPFPANYNDAPVEIEGEVIEQIDTDEDLL